MSIKIRNFILQDSLTSIGGQLVSWKQERRAVHQLSRSHVHICWLSSPRMLLVLLQLQPNHHLEKKSQENQKGGARGGKELACQCRRLKRPGFNPWVRKIPWRRAWQPTPVFLPGESHGQRSLVGYSPQGGTELDMTEVTQHAPLPAKGKVAVTNRYFNVEQNC